MKNSTKVLYFVICFLLLTSVLFAGCSGKTETSGKQETKEETKQESKETQTLTYYGFSEWVGDPKLGPIYEEVVNLFETENPGYEVQLLHDPWGTWEPKYKTLFAAGNPPDVILVNNPDFPIFANGDHLLDLSSYVDDSYLDTFFEGVLGMYTWKDKPMALPFTTDCRVLWYNKNIFEQAGLDPTKPPTTWSEFLEYAEKTTLDTNNDGNVDIYGFGEGYSFKAFPGETLFVASNSGYLDVAADGTITPTVDTPEFRAILELLVGLKPYYNPDFLTLDVNQVATLFAQEKVAMIIAGFWPWGGNEGLEDQDFYELAMIPKFDENAPDGSFGGGFGIAVAKGTKNPEGAVKLAQMLVTPEHNVRLMTDIPATQEGLEMSKFYTEEKYGMFMEQIQYARQGMTKTLYYQQIEDAMYIAGLEAILGKISIDEAITEIEQKIVEITKP